MTTFHTAIDRYTDGVVVNANFKHSRYGMRIAVFYTKLHDRLLRPLTAANHPPAPLRLRQALHTINTYIEDYIGQSRLAT